MPDPRATAMFPPSASAFRSSKPFWAAWILSQKQVIWSVRHKVRSMQVHTCLWSVTRINTWGMIWTGHRNFSDCTSGLAQQLLDSFQLLRCHFWSWRTRNAEMSACKCGETLQPSGLSHGESFLCERFAQKSQDISSGKCPASGFVGTHLSCRSLSAKYHVSQHCSWSTSCL